MADVCGPGPEEASVGNQGGSAAGGDGEAPAAAARDLPVCLIVLGMAGSGKTTFVQVS